MRPRVLSVENAYLIETTDDGSRTLVRQDGDLSFHSGCGAAAECDHVYLHNGGFNGPELHWPQSVLEIGFGTGLAMLRTVDRVVAAGRPLRYVALENTAVPTEVLRQLDLGRGLADPSLADCFLSRWDAILQSRPVRSLPNRPYDANWRVDSDRWVQVIFAEATTWLDATRETFDAVYFDPFDPQSNPELWTEEVFNNLARCLRAGGRLVSYCVKGEIRRRMAATGFTVTRVPGPIGGKPEVLIATR
ncbi:tRNA (5-methylaminomethyl-2-thiouridine)(34)-methyltransferase MnmD [Allorhodopirellula heiligendammensis]|uniref:tRNA 5-methylaminomethyl-2-thiouridine biosynthesis bifunctional protein MnmC n=1 Tax=Allorhodopirellula heiligendammensis TaxID=2714739 RepID=A0A5C6BYZ8_9BACT|nr:tRNA (5-methylaminomethyl-2-thiouridine)(34)-methyltransferase MnmD [Allorhodopirellula heiligendammensis]TWU15819.1 tRNA 5-methylaminomethyl-2-thiouridine biosynthesis bifunctional protein MnmC [Allorhodopirellula heiligendammensis]